MSDIEIEELSENLQVWFNTRLDALNEAASNVKDLDEVTIKFMVSDDASESANIELKTKEEVRAYRIGIISAIASFGEFPISITKN